MMTFKELLAFYEDHLYRQVLPFWLKHGVDREYGGVFTLLRDDGTLESDDKVMWSQGRVLWVYSVLYQEMGHDPQWLEFAHRTARFLLQHGMDENGAWLFRVTRRGEPVLGAESIYVDGFALYGLTEYARATGDEKAVKAARAIFHRTSPLLNNHSQLPTRPHPIPAGVQSHGPSMMFAHVYHELGQLTGDSEILARALELAELVMTQHLKPERQVLLEFVRPGGQEVEGDVGQTFIPGHAIESMWFMERIYAYHRRPERVRQALEAIRWHLERGWDEEWGGIYLACHATGGKPVWHSPEAKLWWPATEALYALLRAYELSGEAWCMEWYWRVHDYTFSHYPNREHGEWYQYLDREGRPTVNLVPGLGVKDPFHLPRALIYSIKTLRNLAEK